MSDQFDEVSGTRQFVRPLTIAVEGNIGSGKSTFLAYCKSDPDINTLYGPVGQWTNVGGVNLLGKFYENPSRYGLTLQMRINLTMLLQYQSKTFKSIKLIERSLLSARHCFQRCMLTNGILEPVMGAVLDHWHESVAVSYELRPHAIIYLQTSPTVALQRLQSRGRLEERTVTLQYIQDLHQSHEEWLEHEHQLNLSGLQDMPIFTINADHPLVELKQQYDECIGNLKLLLL